MSRYMRMNDPLQVLVLGCGPAGLAAVHAVKTANPGSIVRVVSKKRRSHIYGAQYLHAPIPGLPGEVRSSEIRYTLNGTAEGYRRKVYGPDFDGSVSPEDLASTHMGWDLRGTYFQLWDKYNSFIVDHEVHPTDPRYLLRTADYDLVINTIPRNKICPKNHSFVSQDIWAAGGTSAGQIPVPVEVPLNNMVVCNGYRYPDWYRVSRIFDYATVEWPLEVGRAWASQGAALVRKPIGHACTCWPWENTRMLHVGRYGAWQKGYLIHHAYAQVSQVVYEMAGQGYYDRDPNLEVNWV